MTGLQPAAEVSVARRNRLVTVLALHSGMTDAIGFVALGGAFTSVMTGNMVLIGVAASRPDGALALRAAAAVVAFASGCGIGARIAAHRPAGTTTTTGTGSKEVWPAGVTRALRLQLALTVVFAAGWWGTGAHRGDGVQLALLVVNSVCLGLQSSAVQRFGVSGLSTTYLTGTLTTLVVTLATGGRTRDVALSARLLAALIVGAGIGALLAGHAQVLAPLGPLACLATVVVFARLQLHS